jgi:hypothetical protein
MKVVKIKYRHDGVIQCQYMCPGCGYAHAFSPSIHQWNGDVDNPTVRPSLLHSNPQNYHTCHSFITSGKIKFEGDCWHNLKGQTVDLPDFDVSQFDLDYVEIL